MGGGALAFLGIILFGGCSYASSTCQSGSRRLVKGTYCSTYEECRYGGYVLQKCEPGYVFQQDVNSCIPHSHWPCNDDTTACEEGSIFANPNTCHMYYKCLRNRLVTKFCPAGTSFDPIAQTCKSGISCEGPGYSRNPMRSTENSNIAQECTEGEARPFSCRQYHLCKGGEWALHNCALGEIYDQSSNQCTPGDCKQRSKRSVASCTEGHRRRVDGTCNQYTECVNGEEVQKNCSLCMNFDDTTLSCRFFFRYPCPNPPPPVPTDPPTPEPEPTTPEPTTTETSTPEPPTPEPPTPEPPTPEPPTPEPPTPEPPTPEPTTPEPPTPEPPTPEPTTPEPPTPEPPTPEPTTPEPSTPEPPTPEPPTPEPITPEPPTPEPPTPEPPTPEPITPEPASEAASTPESSSADPPLSVMSISNESCKDGDRKSISGNCKEYLQCLYGRYFKDRCNYFQHFDVKSMDCAVFWYTCP